MPELGLGLVAGIGAWLLVIGFLLLLGTLLWSLGGEEMLPTEPPAVIPWIAALPVGLRIALSLSAGVVEETFFRGFLQPRVGIMLSTLLFVLAHASYEEPLMLVGVTLLSIIYALLVRWRQNIWPAIVAHALFDALQLLVVIPTALEFLPPGREEILTPLALAGLHWTAGLIC
jgi:membrane protease YdiL (CAAX protease family)